MASVHSHIITWNAGAAAEYEGTKEDMNPAHKNSGEFSCLACFFTAGSIRHHEQCSTLEEAGFYRFLRLGEYLMMQQGL